MTLITAPYPTYVSNYCTLPFLSPLLGLLHSGLVLSNLQKEVPYLSWELGVVRPRPFLNRKLDITKEWMFGNLKEPLIV